MEPTGTTVFTTGSDVVLSYLPTNLARDGTIAHILSAYGEALTGILKDLELHVWKNFYFDTARGTAIDKIGEGITNTTRESDDDVFYKQRIESIMEAEGGGTIKTLTGITMAQNDTGSWFAYNALRFTEDGDYIEGMIAAFDETGWAMRFQYVVPSGYTFGTSRARFEQVINRFKALGSQWEFGECLPSNCDEANDETGGWYVHSDGELHDLTPSYITTGECHAYGGGATMLAWTGFSYDETGLMSVVKTFASPFNIAESGNYILNAFACGNNTGLVFERARIFCSLTVEGYVAGCGNDWGYEMEFTLEEDQGVARTGEFVNISASSIPTGHCYYDSPRIYLTSCAGTEQTSAIWNRVMHQHCSEWDWSASTDWANAPNTWTNGDGGSQTSLILPHYEGFKKVLRQIDTDGSDRAVVYDDCGTLSDDDHEFSWWFRFDGSNPTADTNNVGILNSTFQVVNGVYFDSGGDLKETNGDNTVVSAIAKDTWHHIRLVINLTSDTCKFYVDFASTPDYTGTAGGRSDMKYIMFETGTTGQQAASSPAYYCYVDHYASGTTGENQFCSTFDISFLATVSASTTNTYKLYYTDVTKGADGYSGLTRSSNVVTTSDGADYKFSASTDAAFCVEQFEDTGGNDWARSAVQWLGILTAFASASAPLWLETNVIFAECIYRPSANQYFQARCYDNGMIKCTFYDNVQANAMFIRHCWDDAGVFVEHWRYHAGAAWTSKAIGAADADVTLDVGKWFFDDTADLETIAVEIFDESQAGGTNARFYSLQADRLQISIGYNGGAAQITQGSGFTFYQGTRDVGSTGATNKQTYMDNLYTELITNALTQSLGAEAEPAHPTNKIYIHEWMGYTKDESGTSFTSIPIDSGGVMYQFKINTLNYDSTYTGSGFTAASVSGFELSFRGESGNPLVLWEDGIHFGKVYSITGSFM